MFHYYTDKVAKWLTGSSRYDLNVNRLATKESAVIMALVCIDKYTDSPNTQMMQLNEG